jgi:hypothetical protein
MLRGDYEHRKYAEAVHLLLGRRQGGANRGQGGNRRPPQQTRPPQEEAARSDAKFATGANKQQLKDASDPAATAGERGSGSTNFVAAC